MPRRWTSQQPKRTSQQPKRWSRYPVGILVRCTEEERAAIHTNAGQAGRSASRFLAELGTLEPGARLQAPLTAAQVEELRTLAFQLRKVGVNLNQLAHRENAADYGTADPPTDEEVNEGARAVRSLTDSIRGIISGPVPGE